MIRVKEQKATFRAKSDHLDAEKGGWGGGTGPVVLCRIILGGTSLQHQNPFSVFLILLIPSKGESQLGASVSLTPFHMC